MTLKQSTSESHIRAEAHPFTKLLVSGNMSNRIYTDYLYNQYISYSLLETLCSNIHTGIQRTSSICADLLEAQPVDPKVYPSTFKYLRHISTLDPKLLLAHVYVRHMGDMYGGQLIKTKVPGSGKMYQFDNRSELIKSLREQLTDDLADEANTCFNLILELFTDIANEHGIQ